MCYVLQLNRECVLIFVLLERVILELLRLLLGLFSQLRRGSLHLKESRIGVICLRPSFSRDMLEVVLVELDFADVAGHLLGISCQVVVKKRHLQVVFVIGEHDVGVFWNLLSYFVELVVAHSLLYRIIQLHARPFHYIFHLVSYLFYFHRAVTFLQSVDSLINI